MNLSSDHVKKALIDGECKLMTNSKSSALVLPTTSYSLTTIGTSNSLVVFPQQATSTSGLPDDGDISESPPKRTKLSKSNYEIQTCRLIQPGGSGASFLSLQRKMISAEAIRSLLQDSVSKKESFAPSDLAQKFQCSSPEVYQALESLPCVILSSKEIIYLLDEEHILQAKRSLVETLCEEKEGENESLPAEELVPLIEKRVTPNEELSESNWSMEVARKILKLACKNARLNKQKIAFWALQDLVLTKKPTWPLKELLSTWQSRLPLNWCQQEGDDETSCVVSKTILEQMPGVQISKNGKQKDAVEMVTIALVAE
jgi:hypothetical protein